VGGACACDAPWHGASCGLLRRGRTRVPGGGIYGYAAPNATTSWGGNAIAESTNGTVTWHLYASEMAGRDCGLHVWGSQSTVVHATAPTVEGPYTRRATVVGAEAHNPQAIVVNGSWYLFHIGEGDSGGTPKDCNETTATTTTTATATASATASAGGNGSGGGGSGGGGGGGGGGSTLHVATSPYGPFSPVVGEGEAPSGCNNPSPVLHPNGTLFLFCKWSIRASASGSPRGPWGPATAVRPPNTAARTWEDPFLWIDARGHFHVLSHTWSALPYPSNAISAHAFSADGGAGSSWTFSAVEPYGNVIEHEDGTAQRFATLERPKLLFTDAARPHTPTHLINGASDFWLGGSADPCAPCGHCSRCKQTLGIDWTYTLMTPLGAATAKGARDVLPCTGNSTDLHAQDCEAWQDLYHSLGGSTTELRSETDPCGEPRGVHCVNNRIDLIDLSSGSFNLRGELPNSISLMSELRTLWLWNASITGTIPHTLAYLPKLYQLRLDGNHMFGAVPNFKVDQFTNCTGQHYCCILTWEQMGWPETNAFDCPLPSGMEADCPGRNCCMAACSK
jgi:hypothetical protein